MRRDISEKSSPKKRGFSNWLKKEFSTTYKKLWNDKQDDESFCLIGKNEKWKIIAAISVIFCFILLSLLKHWEVTNESWGYWYFSKVFLDTGKFVNFDRSPIYTLYLGLFTWMGYPISYIIEYVVTTLFVSLSLFFFIKPYLKIPLATVAVILCIPFMTAADPAVQILALGFAFLAIIARRKWPDRKGKSISYALFGFAYLFRGVYLVFLLAYLGWDFIKIVKKLNWKKFCSIIRPRFVDSLIVIVILLSVLFIVNQSDDEWNNVWLANVDYFPGDGESLIDASFIETINWEYADDTYEFPDQTDFYFTNQELFNGETTIFGAIQANPDYVMKQWSENTVGMINAALDLTNIPRIFVFQGIIICLLIGFAGIKYSIDKKEWVFIICCGLSIIPVILFSVPKTRYMIPFIPIIIIAVAWILIKIEKLIEMAGVKLKKSNPSLKERISRIQKLTKMHVWKSFVIGLILLLFFTNGIVYWTGFAEELGSDIEQGDIRILDSRDYMRQSYSEIESIIANCNGVMAYEHRFIAAFLDFPREKIYDIWEIPPFGRYNNSEYDGLRPDRIDCLLISNELPLSNSSGANTGLRYWSYIHPYEQELLRLGASNIEISGYGRAVILNS